MSGGRGDGRIGRIGRIGGIGETDGSGDQEAAGR